MSGPAIKNGFRSGPPGSGPQYGRDGGSPTYGRDRKRTGYSGGKGEHSESKADKRQAAKEGYACDWPNGSPGGPEAQAHDRAQALARRASHNAMGSGSTSPPMDIQGPCVNDGTTTANKERHWKSTGRR